MYLSDGEGISLSLTVSGYEFPAKRVDVYDWLNVAGKVEHPRGGRKFHEPCLLRDERERLCTWLESVAADPAAEHESEDFIEPNLEFHVVRVRDEAVLRVHLSQESSPPWLRGDDRYDGVDLDFPLASNDLDAAARSLSELLARFPRRG